MKKTKTTIALFLNVIAVLGLSQSLYTQDKTQLNQKDFEKQLITIYTEGNDTQLKSLLQEHRLWVKPFIDKLLTQSMQLEMQGQKEEARQKLTVAEKVAMVFRNIFDEQSLIIAVNYVTSWSRAQQGKKLRADSLYALGTERRRKKAQRDQALNDYLQALDIYRGISDQRGEGTTLGGLGFLYWYKREPEQALSYFQKALDVRQQVDDKQLVGNSFSDIGSVNWYFLRDYPQALKYHLKAESLRVEIGDEVGLGKTLANIALTYWDMGQLNQAFTYYNKAITVNQKVGDEKRMTSALYNCGILLINLGKYPDALDYLERALEKREKLHDKRGAGNVLNQMGIAYRRLGEYELALKSYQKMVALMEEINNEAEIARALSHIGVVFQRLERLEKASEHFQKSLDIYQRLGDQSGILAALTNLGSVYFDLKNYAKSTEFTLNALQLSRELQDKSVEANTLILLGNIQNFEGKYEQALANYQSGLKIAQALNNPELLWPALLGMGDNYERRGDFDKAITYYARALETVEGVRGTMRSEEYKVSFLANKRFAYEAVVHLLGTLYAKTTNCEYERQAFQYAERAKARAFLDLLAEALANVRAGTDPILLQKQEKLLTELSQVRKQLQLESSQAQVDENTVLELKDKIDALEKEYRSLQQEIKLKNPKYSELQYPQPSTMSAIQIDLLDDKTVLLEYSVGDSSSSLWVLTRDSSQLLRLPKREALQEQIDIVRFALLNPQQSNLKFFANASYRLYQQLLQPAENAIKKKNRLVIIPDDVLHYLPFEVLLTEKTDGKVETSYSKLPYLIKRKAISYGQSASVLRSLREQRGKKAKAVEKELLAFGDPVFTETNDQPGSQLPAVQNTFGDSTRGGLARLPYSGVEIENIAKFFSAGQVDIYLRREASEEKVKEKGLEKYKYIHFATHGIINERKPDFSSIVLTQDNDPAEDGYLQAAEIFNLHMNAELVVLSACQTGLGKMVRGEGMIGLTRAFMYAGTPSVLVSLWSVADLSTSQLMENFYKNLVRKKKDKTEALQQAQLTMIHDAKYSHPFYWAPFVLIGDWQ